MSGMLDNLDNYKIGLIGLNLLNNSHSQQNPIVSNLPYLFNILNQTSKEDNLGANTNNQPLNYPMMNYTYTDISSHPASYNKNNHNNPINNITNADLLDQYRASAMSAFPNDLTRQQVAMSQAILESGLNPSSLAAQHNNYFGIKGSGVSYPTTEYTNNQPQVVYASFSQNPDMQSSFNQYKHLLSTGRYKNVLAANSPTDAFNALQQSGYATDPQYAQKLASVYSRYVQPLYSS